MGPRPLLSFQGSGWGCSAGWCGGHWSPRHGGVGMEQSLGMARRFGAGGSTGRLTSQQVTLLMVVLGYRLASDDRMIKPEKFGVSVPLNLLYYPLLYCE